MTLIRFPLFWFVDAPLFLLRLFPRILDLVENRLAVGLHAQMLFTPLFRDTSPVGRTLSFLFRTSRVIAGIATILISLILLALTFAVWLVLPFAIIIYSGWLGVMSVGLFWLGFTLWVANQPHYKITGNDHLDTLERVATASVKRVLHRPGTAKELVISLLGFFHTQSILAKMGVDREKFANEVKKRTPGSTTPINTPKFYQASLDYARKLNHPYVTLADLFLAILDLVPFLVDVLFECDINKEEVQGVIRWMDRQWRLEHLPRFWHPEYRLKRLGGVNRAWTARPTPTLNRFSVDLTREAQLGRMPPTVDRGDIIPGIIQILSRATRDNVLIVGPVGSGKTTLVVGLAHSIIEGGVDPILFSKRIVRLDVPQLIAGAELQGEVEKRIIEIMTEVKNAGNVILFIDQIHTLAAVGTGTESLNVFAALEPYLADPSFQVIGATSWLDYRRYIEPNEAFANSFQLVELSEADEKQTLEILETVTINLEKKHKVTISFKALKAAYQLSERFLHDRVQPDKAVDILEDAASMAGRTQPRGSVTYETIAKVIARRTEIPIEEITIEESEKLLKLEEELHQRVIGQDQAINTIADALRRARVGLREEDRPIAALLFIGPTGVGKTELAKALAEVYFGSEATMVRLDMSEYQTPDSISSLIGTPPSFSGAAYPGRLTEAVRRRPFSLILLDELEKAHPDVLNLFLQVFEDGRLTDGSGRTVKFNNTILIATSNAGTPIYHQAIKEGWSRKKIGQSIHDELRGCFRPELLNRFDGIVIFDPLTKEELIKIVKLKLSKVKNQMQEKNIAVEFSQPLIEKLVDRGYDPRMGARPLRRLIQDTVETYLAKRVLSQEIERGDVVHLGPEVLK